MTQHTLWFVVAVAAASSSWLPFCLARGLDTSAAKEVDSNGDIVDPVQEAENPREAPEKNFQAYDADIDEIIAGLKEALHEDIADIELTEGQAETLKESQVEALREAAQAERMSSDVQGRLCEGRLCEVQGSGVDIQKKKEIITKLREVQGSGVDIQKKKEMIAMFEDDYAKFEMLKEAEAEAKIAFLTKEGIKRAYDADIDEIIAAGLAEVLHEAAQAERMSRPQDRALIRAFAQIKTKLREVQGSDVDIQTKKEMIAEIAAELLTEAEAEDAFAQSDMLTEAEAEAKIALLKGAEAEMLTGAATKIAEAEAEMLAEAEAEMLVSP